MKRFAVVCLFLTFFSVIGCGSGTPSAPSADELSNFVDENREALDAAQEQYKSDF